ncbi:MAG: addiction module toxin, HicA family [Desulfovibrio sp.]|nr:MAG: addiction module toxin, HicA family [Desulfovibrio sp.]
MSSREVIRRLQAAGWRHARTRGSHWVFQHDEVPGRVVVPHPKRDIPIGTLRAIERASGVALR